MTSAPCCEFCCVAGHVSRPEAILRGDCRSARQGCHFGGAEDFGEAGRRPDQISSLPGPSFTFSHFSRKRAT